MHDGKNSTTSSTTTITTTIMMVAKKILIIGQKMIHTEDHHLNLVIKENTPHFLILDYIVGLQYY